MEIISDKPFNMQDFLLPGTPINDVDSPSNNGKLQLNGNAYIDESDVFTYPSETDITDNPADLYAIINYHDNYILPKYLMKDNYYKGRHKSIIDKEREQLGKPDSRIIVNFPKKLVDTFTGFCNFGNVQVTSIDSNQSMVDTVNEELSDWKNRSNFDDLITELSKMSDIYGRSYLYAFENGGSIDIAPCSPKDTIVVYDDTVKSNPLFAIRYSETSMGYSGTLITRERDYSFGTNNGIGSVGMDLTIDKNTANDCAIGETANHEEFPCLPVIELRDNEERIGLIDDVVNLIDSVNKTISDKVNDTSSFKNSYLAVTGMEMHDIERQKMQQSNFINVYNDDDFNDSKVTPDVKFVSPDPNDTQQEHVLDRNIDLIYQISQIVDMNDNKAGSSMSNISGTALFQRYQTMQAKGNTKAKKLKAVLRQLFQILFAYKNINEDIYKLKFTFNFNLPHNITEETQAFSAVDGRIPDDYAISYLSSIEDKSGLLAKMQDEREKQNQQFAQVNDSTISNDKGE